STPASAGINASREARTSRASYLSALLSVPVSEIRLARASLCTFIPTSRVFFHLRLSVFPTLEFHTLFHLA
ncbi:MAG: hypothetical protein WAL51_05435, partial [Candidatus Acidiferrales bacterium]